jgi:hypothetical protein
LGVILVRSEHQAQVRSFLSAYEQKDIQAISKMFSRDVVVRDWNLEVFGAEAALAEFAKNFEEADSLSIQVSRIFESEQGVAAEIEILVNGSQKLSVVDVFSFNEAMEITSVISYKGL